MQLGLATTTPDCSQLSVKLHPCEVNDKTLQHIKELWETVAEDLLQLPDLDAVLHNIQEGCLYVSWLITPKQDLEHLIRRRISCCKGFFRIIIMLNNECIYQEEVHVHVHMYLTGRIAWEVVSGYQVYSVHTCT